MSTIRKKKIRIKKKNFTIFLFIVIVFVFTMYQSINLLTSSKNSSKKESTVSKREIIKNKEPEKEKVEINSIYNLENNCNYFNKDYLERYLAYKESHNNLEDIQIIKNVNMQLDKVHYEERIPARNLNTEKVLVNKYYYLERDYVPDNLETISKQYALSDMKMVKEAKEAFESLSKQAKKEKLNIVAMSTYRSYEYQVNLWNRYAKTDGEEQADTYSGRAGHSEHQTGLAVDVYNEKETYTNFEKTKEFNWMQEHAHEYGFILRFPKDKEEETGYQYESWHYRYVGKDAAQYIKENNISFEEYYATIIKDW